MHRHSQEGPRGGRVRRDEPRGVSAETATVIGHGVAALCVARLLAREGVPVRLIGRPPRHAPMLLLNDVTANLIREFFGGETDLFAGAQRLERRRVLWGSDADNTVAAAGISIDGRVLRKRLAWHLRYEAGGLVTFDENVELSERALRDSLPGHGPEVCNGTLHWVFDASGRRAPMSRARLRAGMGRVGNRGAVAATVPLAATVDETTCTIETVSDGWLFLLPLGSGRGLLQGILPEVADDGAAALVRLLGQARAIPALIAAAPDRVATFDAWPGLTDPPGAPGWLAVGDAAVAFDPLCGDGTGQAIRCAILAVAVSRSIAAGDPAAPCLDHYRNRLRLTFLSHLRACRAFYEPAFFSQDWRGEIATTERAITVLEGRLGENADASTLPYRLRGVGLTPHAMTTPAF